MKFVDEVIINAIGGDGGDGHIGWHREKYVSMGGPDGGDGGNGGSVVFVADRSVNTLVDFSFSPTLRAESGAVGGSNNKHGTSGSDLIRKVPVGTQCYMASGASRASGAQAGSSDRAESVPDTELGAYSPDLGGAGEESSKDREQGILADLSVHGATWVVARGGRGGRGNTFFKSSQNRAPHIAERGQAGENIKVRLSLKLVADVGLVGLPNAGKSTLISTISAARPKIADYPFTTLVPNLGVVRVDEEKSFVVADVPGLIPGASEGKGLGHEFLKHLERTAFLLYLLDLSHLAFIEPTPSDDVVLDSVVNQYSTLNKEVRAFSDLLASRQSRVVFSKCDYEVVLRAQQLTRQWFSDRNITTDVISSHNGVGIKELCFSLYTACS